MSGNYSDYGGASYGSPKKKGFFTNPKKAFARQLWFTAFITGIGIALYPVMSSLFSALILKVPPFESLYTNNVTARYALETAYSFMCVGLPFGLVRFIQNRFDIANGNLPLGAPGPKENAFLLIFAGLGLCFAGNILTSVFVNFCSNAGIEFYSYEAALKGNDIPGTYLGIIVFIFRSALVPALIEEFAFRGVIMQPLRKYGDWFAIVTAAICFGFMHGNMTQMPFAILAGIALGYTSVVTGSLWTSIIIHFSNNLISVVYSFVQQNSGSAAGMIFSTLCTYGFIFIGLVCFVIYTMRNPNFYRLYPAERKDPVHKTAAFFLAPTVLFGLLALGSYFIADIK